MCKNRWENAGARESSLGLLGNCSTKRTTHRFPGSNAPALVRLRTLIHQVDLFILDHVHLFLPNFVYFNLHSSLHLLKKRFLSFDFTEIVRKLVRWLSKPIGWLSCRPTGANPGKRSAVSPCDTALFSRKCFWKNETSHELALFYRIPIRHERYLCGASV